MRLCEMNGFDEKNKMVFHNFIAKWMVNFFVAGNAAQDQPGARAHQNQSPQRREGKEEAMPWGIRWACGDARACGDGSQASGQGG